MSRALTGPRGRAAEQALGKVGQIRRAWARFKDARAAIGRQRTLPGEMDAVNAALLAERELDALLGAVEPELTTYETPAGEIPGRPGWPIEYEGAD